MRGFAFTILISLSLPVWGLAPGDLILSPDADLTAPATVSAAQVQADLEVLSYAARKAYAGPGFLKSLRQMGVEDTDPKTLCDRLDQVFAEVRDAHLMASLEAKRCGRKLPRGGVGQNLSRDKWSLQTVTRDGHQVSVLAVPSFWPKFDERWNGFLQTVRRLRAAEKPFVIDLRGNGGGDDSMGFEMARVLLGMPDHVNLPTPVKSRTFLQSAEAFALQSNVWAFRILQLKSKGERVPEYLVQRRDEILDWVKRAEHGEFPETYIERIPQEEVDRKVAFQQPVYVLVDRSCASACETTLQVLEYIPSRILVGENTMGAVEYGDLGRVVLPNSKINVTVATMKVEFRDGRHPEKVGYAPDVRVEEGGDALDTALTEILK